MLSNFRPHCLKLRAMPMNSIYIDLMKAKTQDLLAQIKAAEDKGQCLIPVTDSDRRALNRLVKSKKIVNPYCGLYADTKEWNRLWYADRVRKVAKTLAIKHPHWIFTGETAAALWGFDVFSPSNTISPQIYLDNEHSNYGIRQLSCLWRESISGKVQRIYNDDRTLPINLNDVYTSLCVCAATLPFRSALPIFDSALKLDTNFEKLYAVCGQNYASMHIRRKVDFLDNYDFQRQYDANPYFMNTNNNILSRLQTLLRLADPESDNPGESFARATILALGFAEPELQRPFPNPHYPNNRNRDIRADFSWVNKDGEIIVAEFDGVGKYQLDDDSSKEYDGHRVMTDNQETLRKAFERERTRELALRNAGVYRIVRIQFINLIHPRQLEQKLESVGVPRIVA